MYILQMLWKFRIFLGHLPGHRGCFFLSCPHTWCRCSSLSQVIYPDSRAFIFGFLYILQMLLKFCIFLGHLPGQGGCFIFGFSTHYIIQLLPFCSGHLPRHRGHFLRVFCTLRHPDAPAFLGTFTWTWGLFFLGFPHTTSSSCSSFAQDIYLYRSCFFSGFPHTTSSSCSGFSQDIYLDTGVVFFRVFHTLHHPVAPVLLGKFIQT